MLIEDHKKMEFWPEYVGTSWGREFVAGGFGGIAGIVSGHPFDTLRIRQQQNTNAGSAFRILRNLVSREGPSSLFKGMGAPLASITFQNAVVFQTYATLARAVDSSPSTNDPPSYKAVAMAGFGAGALQSLIMSPAELVKIRLQLQNNKNPTNNHPKGNYGPISVIKNILRTEGLKGMCRGLGITTLRDAPAHAIYFWAYEYMKEQFHPGCRKNGQECLTTMLIAGGFAGVVSWTCCYPFDVIKTRLQAQTTSSQRKYNGIMDCICKSIQREGYCVLWRGSGTTIARAFIVNAAIFSAYEITLRSFFPKTESV